MKYFMSVLALMFSVSAFAAVDIDTRGLTDAQKAQLVQQAEQMKNSSTAAAVGTTVDKVDQWVNLGEKMGKMLGGAAKEVGIAVNEFVQTPVGKMTAVLIVWNYMGNMIVHVVSGWALLITTFGLLFWYSKRVQKYTVEYDKEAGRNWLGRYPIKSIKRDEMPSDAFGFILLGYAISMVVSIWTMFAW